MSAPRQFCTFQVADLFLGLVLVYPMAATRVTFDNVIFDGN